MRKITSEQFFGVLMWWLVIMVLVVMVAGIAHNLTTPQPSAIEVFSARFDECMATEKYTREECIAYADEGE